MRAITVHQPWAWLIANGWKSIETRGWAPPKALIGERIAIHAGLRRPTAEEVVALGSAMQTQGIGATVNLAIVCWGSRSEHYLPYGAVVATAVLAEALPIISQADYVSACPDPYPCVSIGSFTSPTAALESGVEAEAWRHPHLSLHRGYDDFEVIDREWPFGNFNTDEGPRWGWRLTDVERLDEPVAAKGRQRLWEWTP